ncbi:MAG: DEAD/DEAH box helicase [Methyloceanibacter sp.]|uniref:DEAD/DEAH box helicase n=1 Tax=Methyloceanibacter sp. TaxID=1965321 RepID=UPI003D6C9540
MTSSFDSLGLVEPLRRALNAEKYLKPTPIQVQAIPVLLEGNDLLGVAETGTGKTAAFSLPLLHRLSRQPGPRVPGAPRALILAPTRELARQIGERIDAYGRHLSLRGAVIFGGVGQGQQVKALRAGVDILVATPGRLLDLCGQRHVRLDKVSILVLDEADRMLDMGFIHDVRKIVGLCGKERQTLLFSATMPPPIAKLAHDILREPVRIDVSPVKVAVERIEQRVYFVGAKDKRTLLTELIKDPAMGRVLVFTRTKRGADRVCRFLVQAGIAADALHGNKAQNARVRALDGFRNGKVRALVATDIAARGIDVPGISHVINYELPNEPESYVHRIGRTARAGAGGAALSLCDNSERAYLTAIERLMRARVDVAEHRLAETLDEPVARAPARIAPARPADKRRRRQRSRRPARAATSNSFREILDHLEARQ